ncbi:MAG TPA: UDP-N-acetylmuramoyl-L-alanine--D-glutamate ligase [Limnochordia bacterium]
MEWSHRRVAVVGLGLSNLAVARFWLRAGAQVTGCDQKRGDELGERLAPWRALGIPLRLGPGYMDGLASFDAIALTPGMRKDHPEIAAARRAGVLITSEMALFLDACRARVVGVTGSRGKTTTTALLGEMASTTGRPVYVGGNIGRPLLEVVAEIEADAVVVLEMSSFQLELLDRSPAVAVITNIAPDHLDHHGTMESYLAAKARIFAHQRPEDWLIHHGDDPLVRGLIERACAQRAEFSRLHRVAEGAYLEDGWIHLAREDAGVPVGPVAGLRLVGAHNVENVLAACAAADKIGVTPSAMRQVCERFRGVPHRLEHVADIDGVAYYNDSIATTPSRTLAGIQAFDRPVVLIAGGYDKRLPFDELAEQLIGRVHTVVLLGQTKEAIAQAIDRAAALRDAPPPSVIRADSLEDAVAAAAAAARPGDVVLLSPACASYDLFRNYEERGERFRRLVTALRGGGFGRGAFAQDVVR